MIFQLKTKNLCKCVEFRALFQRNYAYPAGKLGNAEQKCWKIGKKGNYKMRNPNYLQRKMH